MVVTVVLSGIPQHIPLLELASALDKFIRSDEVGTFTARELPNYYRKGKRQVALDFKDGFNAMAAQETLNGYRYKLPDDSEYILSARVTKEPSLMAGNSLVPYNSRGSSYKMYDDEVQEQLRALQNRLKIVRTETELIGAEKNLRKLKKKYLLDESDTDSESTSRRKRKKGKKKKRRRSSSSSSRSRSMSAPSLHSPDPASSSGIKSRFKETAQESKRESCERSLSSSSKSDDSNRRFRSPSAKKGRRSPSPRKGRKSPSPRKDRKLSTSARKRPDTRGSPVASSSRYDSSERSVGRSKSGRKRRHKSREESTSRHKLRERSTSRHTLHERSTSRHKLRERSTSRHTLHERSTSRHKLRERSTSRHRSPDYVSSSRRSRRRHHSPTRSPSPVAHSSRRSPHRSGENLYKDYYQDTCEDAYTGIMYKRRSTQLEEIKRQRAQEKKDLQRLTPEKRRELIELKDSKEMGCFLVPSAPPKITKGRPYDSQVVYVNRNPDKYGYMRPAGLSFSPSPLYPPRATVTEIQEGEEGEIIDDGDVDYVLDAVNDLVENDEDPEASPRFINVKINVVPRKRDADPDLDLEEDRSNVKRVKTENDKVTEKKKAKKMPRPMVDDYLNIKKENTSREYDNENRNAMPRPMVIEEQEHIMVWKEVIKIEDDYEIPYKPQKKKIAKNPRFVIAVNKLIKKMNSHIKDLDEELKRKFLPIMRKVLRMRIKNLLAGKTYFMPTAAILELYRETFPMEDDCGLVISVLDHMREGKFNDFVPSSDDEDEENKNKNKKVSDAPVPEIFQTYVTGKRGVISNDNTNQKDDDVIILEKKVDVIDITDKEGKIKEEPASTSVPNAENDSHNIIYIDCDELNVKKESEYPVDVGLSDISVKTEVDRSEAAKDSIEGINLTNIKAEIITEMPYVVTVKSENVESVASNSTQGNHFRESNSGDAIGAREAIISLVKSEPKYDVTTIETLHHLNSTTDIATEETAAPSQANRDELINDILKLSNEISDPTTIASNDINTHTKEKESSTKDSQNIDDSTNKKNKDSVKKSKAKGKESVKKSKNKSKDTGKRTDKSRKAGTDDITAQNSGKRAEKEQTSNENPKVLMENAVKKEIPEQEESLESIEKFVDLHTKVIQID